MIQLIDKNTGHPYDINHELMASKFLESEHCKAYSNFHYNELYHAVLDFINNQKGLYSKLKIGSFERDSWDFRDFEILVRPKISEFKAKELG